MKLLRNHGLVNRNKNQIFGYNSKVGDCVFEFSRELKAKNFHHNMCCNGEIVT